MAVKVQSTIEPYNNSYFVANAKNIGVGEPGAERSLEDTLKDAPSGEMQATVVDLAALGLPPLEVGKGQTLTTDTTEIMAALNKGIVAFGIDIVRESGTIHYNVTTNMLNANGTYFCYYTGSNSIEQETISIGIGTGVIIAGVNVTPIGGGDITVDSELSLESENPVQNKVVTQEFKAFNEAIGDTNRRVSALESGGGGGGEYAIPTFDLALHGLPTILPNGEYVQLGGDTTDIKAALEKGAVKVIVKFNMGVEVTVSLVLNPACVLATGEYSCTAINEFNDTILITTVGVGNGYIAAKCTPMDNIIGAYIDVALGGDY